MLLICYNVTFNIFSQSKIEKKWQGETSILSSFYRLGTYSKERPTFFLEQGINYQINDLFSIGTGLGINIYPALFALPIQIQGNYRFNIKNQPFALSQAVGRNIKLSDNFFRSNRYLGELKIILPVKKTVHLAPRLGYNLLWDKYNGRSLSYFIGIGLIY